MADQPTAGGQAITALQPGFDEITLTTPGGRHLCNTLSHRKTGRLADAMVTFGQLGTRWHRDALWQDSWRRTYPMCGQCWDDTRQVAQAHRPGLVIHDHRAAPSPASPPPEQPGER
jgi:hypothetical protein